VPSGGKAPAMKEFKIYRWVRVDRTGLGRGSSAEPSRSRRLVWYGMQWELGADELVSSSYRL
jgi:hypothetical protein